MEGQQTLSALGRVHEQFDLPAFDEVDRLILITGSVNIGVSGNLEAARNHRLALQRITQLLFEFVGLRSLLNRHRVPLQCPR
jgi:hypothetical protein